MVAENLANVQKHVRPPLRHMQIALPYLEKCSHLKFHNGPEGGREGTDHP